MWDLIICTHNSYERSLGHKKEWNISLTVYYIPFLPKMDRAHLK